MNVLGLIEKIYGGAAVMAEPALCLHTRSNKSGCRQCLEACPVQGALTLTESGPELDPLVCKGCGLCEPACPIGVFTLKENSGLLPKLGEGPLAMLTCSIAGAGDPTLKVPCLGNLPAETLAAAALGRTLLLVAPEACAACTLGAAKSLEPRVTAANAVLATFGLTGQVKLVHGAAEARAAADRANRLGAAGALDGANGLDRRAFLNFARLSLMATATAVVKPAATPAPLHELPTRVPQGRRHFLEALRKRTDLRPVDSAPPGGAAFGAVTARPGCDGCEACTHSCPGGALQLTARTGASDLLFTADRCTACGLCVEACPHGLLALAPNFSPAAMAEGRVTTLTSLPVATCPRCGKPYHGDGGPCPDCRKIDWMTTELLGRG